MVIELLKIKRGCVDLFSIALETINNVYYNCHDRALGGKLEIGWPVKLSRLMVETNLLDSYLTIHLKNWRICFYVNANFSLSTDGIEFLGNIGFGVTNIRKPLNIE